MKAVHLNRRTFLGSIVSLLAFPQLSKGVLASTYTNPVFEPILADPTVIRATDGLFYAYGTADNWGDGQGARLVPIIRSANLTQWEYVGTAFKEKPKWKSEGGIWAPEVVEVQNKYLLYYAFSTWGDKNPGIGVASATHPAGPFQDHGKLFLSNEVDVPNSIDPFYYKWKGTPYMFWGSYGPAPRGGTYGIALSKNGLSIADTATPIQIAAGDFEALIIHKKGSYFYFIGSKGHCCDGENSTYRLLAGRSKSLFGPYLDDQGRDLRNSGSGKLILESNETFVGPGHCSRIITDKRKNDWILYHAMVRGKAKVSSGTNRRTLCLDQVIWKDGWPHIAMGSPSSTPQQTPQF